MVIDTHCHLYDEAFDEDLDLIMKNAKNDNIEKIIIVGASLEDSKQALKIAEKYENVYAIIGSHPESYETYSQEELRFYEENANNKKVVAIGEIGLDYHYCKENKEAQKQMLVDQIKLANKVNLPICFHVRDAYEDFLEILNENKNLLNYGGVVHCFSGSLEFAKEMIKLGLKLGIDGPITFKNNRRGVEVIENLDLKHFVVETDAPYLSPEPFRGMRNEPKNVNYVVKKIAEIKNMPIMKVEEILLANTYDLYKKIKD